jgi:dipeptidyl aminopeptidase/acylaminoacyl peptidase
VATDRGGNERYQLFTAPDDADAPLRGPDDLDPLVVDDEHIHRPGGVTRDGRLLAYATNRGDGVAFDTWVRDLTTGEEHVVYASGGWTGPGGFSPDGRHLAVAEVTTRPGDNRVFLLDRDVAGRDGPVGPDGPGVVELAPTRRRRRASARRAGSRTAAASSSRPTSVARSSASRAAHPTGAGSTWSSPGGTPAPPSTGPGATCSSCGTRTVARARSCATPGPSRSPPPCPSRATGWPDGFRFTRDGRFLAFGYSSPLVPGDVWRFDTATGALDRLTVSPCDVDPAGFVDAELVHVPSFDGLEVPAFVYRPRGRSGPSPVVVVIHGGPESQYRPSFTPLTQYLVAHGFAVVAPNVRGSTGYGRAYQHLDDVDKRLDSVRDLAAIHAWLGTQDDLDQDRAALYGGSYGGYMVLAGLAFQPELWAAGVDIVGMSNLVTFLENTSAWRRAFREREYGSLAHDRELLEQLSPITHVDAMRAPLLIIHGANDPRVPLGEAEQIHAVLTARGVRSELLVYPDEGHGLSKLVNRIDAYPQVAAFLHEVLDA